MEHTIEMIETTIPKGRTLRIQDGKGLALKVVAGRLWVTQAGDVKDVVLGATDTHCVSRDGATLVHAFEAARLEIAYPAHAGVPGITVGGGYREVGSSVFAGMVGEWLRSARRWFDAAARARAMRGDLPA